MNEVSAVDSVLKVAAEEAASSGCAEISAAHLLISLSRFSEMDAASPAAFLAQRIKGEFDQLGIEPRRFRRRLRSILGKSIVPNQGGVIHRSPQCKAVFLHAERLATEERVPLDGGHLVRAAFLALSGAVTSGKGGDASNGISPLSQDIPTEL